MQMEELDLQRYTILVKLINGWNSYFWPKFFDRYREVSVRKRIISNPEKGYIYDNDSFKKLNEKQGLELLMNFEFSECDNFIEWEYFIDAYKDTSYKDVLKKALDNLEKQLIEANRLIRLKQYKDLFPKGIFINEVKFKISMIQKGLEEADLPDYEKEISEDEKKEILTSIRKEKSKIEDDYLEANSQPGIDLEAVSIVKAMRKEIGSGDIEHILSEAIRVLDDLSIDRIYTDKLITISAQYTSFRFKQTANILSAEDESVIYSSIIDRILKLFNLILDHYEA